MCMFYPPQNNQLLLSLEIFRLCELSNVSAKLMTASI
ncbi:unnamed protein product, partial [Brassica napus]